MKTIGLIGGMSWESTQTYYRLVNQMVREELGGLHSAKIVLLSVDFAEIDELQKQGDWKKGGDIMASAALSLQAAGADAILIGANTMHKVAEAVEHAVRIPLLHIADATASAIKRDNITTVGLLGTKFTMEQEFYRARLESHGIQVILPDDAQRETVHSVIYNELCRGEFKPESKARYLDIVADLSSRGAQGVILGCTEIGLLINSADTSVRLYDTTEIHARRAVEFALNE
ncbi:MAG TPA: aspartate/glutamate racemase family protein [Pseudohongiella sp.]|nr:aspartate/glutamate racemase family protein [Pseudohongiella sp.]